MRGLKSLFALLVNRWKDEKLTLTAGKLPAGDNLVGVDIAIGARIVPSSITATSPPAIRVLRDAVYARFMLVIQPPTKSTYGRKVPTKKREFRMGCLLLRLLRSFRSSNCLFR